MKKLFFVLLIFVLSFMNLGAEDLSTETGGVVSNTSGSGVGIGTTTPDDTLQVVGGTHTGKIGIGIQNNTGFIALLNNTANEFIRLIKNGNASPYWDIEIDNNFHFDIGSNSRSNILNIKPGGNIGIGRWDPQNVLDIQVSDINDQGILIRNETGNVRTNLTLSGTSGNREGRMILFDDSGNMNVMIHSDSSSYFRGGNFGIGNNNPQRALHVSAPASTVALILERPDAVGNTGLELANTNGLMWTLQHDQGRSGTPFRIFGGAGDFNILRTNGNIGVGTDSPTEKMTIEGNINLKDTLYISTHDSPTNRVSILGTNAKWTGSTYVTPDASVHGASMEIHRGSGQFKYMDISAGGTSVLNVASIGMGNKDSHFNSEGGFLGVGTKNPTAKLTVDRAGGTPIVARFQDDEIPSSAVDIRATTYRGEIQGINQGNAGDLVLNPDGGNVGIGTASPEEILHVEKATKAVVKIESDTADSLIVLRQNSEGAAFSMGIDQSGSGRFKISSNSGDLAADNVLTIESGGDVGIGTINPANKLDVTAAGENCVVSLNAPANYAARLDFTEVGDTKWDILKSHTGEFQFRYGTNAKMTLDTAGRVGIGTASPDEKLTVAGKIKAREVIVTATAGADFVFEEDYDLKPLAEVEKFVKKNKHLPEIPSAKEMVKNGVSVNELQIKLLQKIEELTLHAIEQNRKIEDLIKINKQLSNRLSEIENN